MIHLTSIGIILDEESMDFYLAGENGEPSHKLDIDYRDAINNEHISEGDINLVYYYGELHEAQLDYEAVIQEAKEDYYKSVKIITNYYRSFRGIR